MLPPLSTTPPRSPADGQAALQTSGADNRRVTRRAYRAISRAKQSYAENGEVPFAALPDELVLKVVRGGMGKPVPASEARWVREGRRCCPPSRLLRLGIPPARADPQATHLVERPRPAQQHQDGGAPEAASARPQEQPPTSPAKDLLALLMTSRRFYALRDAVTQHLRRVRRGEIVRSSPAPRRVSPPAVGCMAGGEDGSPRSAARPSSAFCEARAELWRLDDPSESPRAQGADWKVLGREPVGHAPARGIVVV